MNIMPNRMTVTCTVSFDQFDASELININFFLKAKLLNEGPICLFIMY